MAAPRLIVATVASAFLASCTSPCGLKLQQHVFLPAAELVDDVLHQRDIVVPCCGGSVYRDVDLSALDDIQVDITNLNATGSGVDGFLTDVTCEKLFDTYSGNPASPLCTIHVGPVAPRTTSARRAVSARRHRLFAQAWTSNQSAASISLDMSLWSTDCRWNPIDP